MHFVRLASPDYLYETNTLIEPPCMSNNPLTIPSTFIIKHFIMYTRLLFEQFVNYYLKLLHILPLIYYD